MAYTSTVIFIETSVFTKEIKELLPDDLYRQLQWRLVFRPNAGSLIRGSGGLRKVRWNLPGEGKRGGSRIIYYWDGAGTIYMLLPYKKADQEDLTPVQLRVLRNLVREWLS